MIELNPFNKCKDCRHEHSGRANMPCRACTFGNKFERAIKWGNVEFDVTKLLPTQKIVENVDRNSLIPNLMHSVVYDYCKHDVETTEKMYDIMNRRIEEMKNRKYIPEIKDVIFNPPATIVLWRDRTKTVVKAQEGESFDPEKGLAMAICKKLYDNKGSFNNVFHKYIDKYEEKVRKERLANIDEVHLYGADDIKRAAEQATAAINRVSKSIADAVNNNKE